jgi:hypothetical protein
MQMFAQCAPGAALARSASLDAWQGSRSPSSSAHAIARLTSISLLVLTALCSPALAQTPGSSDAQSQPPDGQSNQPAPADRSDQSDSADARNVPVTPTRSVPGRPSETQLRVASFGLGGAVRPGDWLGLLVDVTDNADKPRNVVIRVSVPDADGDTALIQRRITPNPGERQSVWLYFRLPSGFKGGDVLQLTAHLAEDDGTTDAGIARFRTGRLLGSLDYLIAAQSGLFPTESLIAVVGQRWSGLEQFVWTEQSMPGLPPTGHEYVRAIPGLRPVNIPDRWMGLAAFESLVWNGPGTDEQPGLLRAEQADAIREWVRRGGHFVIVLPAVGQNWIGGAGANPLADIMPRVRVNRSEGRNLDEYRSLLTRENNAAMPQQMVIQDFASDNAGPYDHIPIMTGPRGDAVVTRRLIGTGMVTVVGIDIASPKLNLAPGSFQADLFWNRILGKRARLLSPEQLAKEQRAGSFASRFVQDHVDSAISSGIARTASAAAGVLLAIVVFAGYWLLAGPLGFLLLKRTGRIQHAWLGFLAAVAIFTVIAWGGANLLKIQRVEGQHLTIIDIVYGQTIQRARSWVSVMLPSYGEQRIAMVSSDSSAANTLAPWEPPVGTSGASSAIFPDARGYEVESRAPDAATFPARSTVKQLQLDWAGSLPASWGLPVPNAARETPIGQELRIEPRAVSDLESLPGAPSTTAMQRRWQIAGSLRHQFPGPIKDLTIILVRDPTPAGLAPLVGIPPFTVAAGTLPADFGDQWLPSQDLPLDRCFPVNVTDPDRFLRKVRGEALGGIAGIASARERAWSGSAAAIALYPLLTPPDPSAPEQDLQVRRQSTHGLDLGEWFTKPCIIILGTLDNVDLPVPLSVDNIGPEVVQTRIKGRVSVRWVYPLPANPLQARPAPPPEAAAP